MKTFIEFSQAHDRPDSAGVILNETPSHATSQIARVIYRKQQQLHLEIRNSQKGDPVVKLMSEQIAAIAALLMLVLAEHDATLTNFARVAQ